MTERRRPERRGRQRLLPPAIDRVISDPAFDPELCSRIRRWAQRVRFRRYLFDNAGKIAKKLRQVRNLEDQRDVGVELFAARMFLNVGSSVSPEPGRAGPDLLVAVGRESFYCEVARIREAALQVEWDLLLSELKERVEPLKEAVSVQLDLERLREDTLVLRLVENRFEDFVRAVREAGAMPTEREAFIDLSFVSRGTVRLRVIPLPLGNRGYFECPVNPVFYTDLEFRKFSDILCVKLRQLRPGKANVLYIRSNSSTHMQTDLHRAVEELSRRAAAGDDEFFARKGFAGIADFQGAASHLTAILLDDLWKPVSGEHPSARVWYHDGAAVELSEFACRKLAAACRVRR